MVEREADVEAAICEYDAPGPPEALPERRLFIVVALMTLGAVELLTLIQWLTGWSFSW